MPRTVDHDEKRTALAEALARVAARNGLDRVSMRSVASEAGVSLRQVQYYFHSKDELLVGALRRLEEQSNARWEARLAECGEEPDPRLVLAAFIAEALPTDEPSRDFYLVSAAFTQLAMTTPAIATDPLAEGVSRLRSAVFGAFRAAHEREELVVGADPEAETDSLIAVCNGLSTAVLIGHHSPERAVEVASYHLDRAFRSSTAPSH